MTVVWSSVSHNSQQTVIDHAWLKNYKASCWWGLLDLGSESLFTDKKNFLLHKVIFEISLFFYSCKS